MGALMKRIRAQTGTSRVVFAMLNKDRSRLRTRLALGGDAVTASAISISTLPARTCSAR